MTALPIDEAARALGVRPGTLARWLRAGAPAARRGSRGRGNVALIDPAAVEAWRREQRHEPACVRLLRDLAAIAPDLAADAALAGVAMHSPSTQGGGERQRLHAAARDIAANVEAALRAWAENRSLE